MTKRIHPYLLNGLLVSSAALVAVHPAVWLVNTWLDASYASHGAWIGVLVLGLFLFSLTSRRRHADRIGVLPLALLAASASVRLASQLLGVNILGALTLVVDVYAIGKWTGLAQRVRAISPGWLSLLFMLSLPLERALQRSVGFGLQQLSAAGACEVLKLGGDPVVCKGVRILIAQRDVLVDLPCSGARVLMLLLVACTVIATLIRPSWRQAAAGLAVTVLAALGSNVIRISLIALGIAHRNDIADVDVMSAPWHELIGLSTIALGLVPLLAWRRYCSTHRRDRPRRLAPAPVRCCPVGYRYAGALALLVVSIVAVTLRPNPIDVASGVAVPELPVWLNGRIGTPLALTVRESGYYERYGGHATRSAYGDQTLTLVRTSAPLRHLHAPDECLRGSGHKVRYVGIARAVVPSAVYRSIDPDGRQWRVAVTFVSDRGEVTTSVAHVVWLWFQRPRSHWTLVQRVTPWSADSSSAHAFDSDVSRALDIPVPGARKTPAFIQTIPRV